MSVKSLTLVLGGARSGKSRQAEAMLTALPPPWIYVATAEALDAEMAARIASHRESRAPGWRTIEAPVRLAGALAAAGSAPVLVDCLTLWLSNLMLGGHDLPAAIRELEQALVRRRACVVLVANEVGLGIVPETKMGRAFRDEAGLLNQRLASLADRVVLMAAGLPLVLKSEPTDG